MSVVLAPPLSPYKGLAAFEDSELDALLFFGREREREVIVANLLASRLTVLYGESGVGKSSLLAAAVVPDLRALRPDADLALLRTWSGPVEDLLALLGDSPESYLILDQFEEYFLYHGDDDEPGTVVHDLPELLRASRSHVLVSLREDSLARLDAFKARVPSVFANRIRLEHLDRDEARRAIVGPLEQWSEISGEAIGAEPAFVEAVLDEVAAGRQGGKIEAPYLQLVLERIWNAERSAGSPLLRLETLRRLGGVDTIVREHLERELSSLSARDAALAAGALRHLVTPSRTKVAHTLDDLAGFTDADAVDLQPVLEALSRQRILRTVDGEAATRRYEIFHDVLTEPVLAWRQQTETAAAVMRERRRHRRIGLLAACALVLALAMAALAVYALSERRSAQHEAAHARASQVRAETAATAAQASARRATLQRRRADANFAEAQRQERIARQNAARARRSEQAAELASAHARVAQGAAEQAQRLAEAQRLKATATAAVARSNAALARTQARRAQAGEDVARATALLGSDPVAAVRAGLAAAALERSDRVEDALRAALAALRVRAVLQAGGPVARAVFSRDGGAVATGSRTGLVRLFALDGRRVSSRKLGSPVVGLDFTTDGSLLVAATESGAVILLDRHSGVLVRSIAAGTKLLAASVAADGAVLTGDASALRVWDSRDGTLLHAIGTAQQVDGMAVSRDGRLAAVFGLETPTVQVIDIAAGRVLATLRQQGNVTSAAFSPDGSLLVTGGHRNGYVWDTGTWSQRQLLVGHTTTITAVVFAPDGRVVTTSEDSSARIWNPATGAQLFILASQHQQKILAVAVAPDGDITTASADRTARIWPGALGQVPTVLAGHGDSVTGVSYSPDGKLVLTASDDGTARLWDATSPSLWALGTGGGRVDFVRVSPDGSLLLAGGADGVLRLWRSGVGLVQTLRHDGKVTAASFVDGNRLVLSASEDGTARLWRVADGTAVTVVRPGAPVRAALAVSQGRFVTAGGDGSVRLWSIAGAPLWAHSQGSPVTAAAVGGNVLATGGADGVVRLWDASSGRQLGTRVGHQGAVTALAVAPDGSRVASGGADATVRLWDPARAGFAKTLVGPVGSVTTLGFSPDGRLLLGAGSVGTAILWDAANGSPVRDLRFHVGLINAAAFSADGRWIVTAGPSAAGLWQTRTGTLFEILRGGTGALTAAAFAPRGWTLATGGNDGSVRTYSCPLCAGLAGLQALAERRLAALGASGR